MTSCQFSTLFQKYLNGEATPEEVHQLMELISRSEYDPRLKALLEEAWIRYSDSPELLSKEESAALLGQVLRPEPENNTNRRPALYSIIGWAAAAVVLATVGLLWLSGNRPKTGEDQPRQVAEKKMPEDVGPGTSKAVLMMGEGAVVVLDSASDGLLDRSVNAQIIKKDSFISYRHVQHSSGAVRFDKIVTPLRGTYRLELSDGTKVWLNAASSLRFPVAFTGDTRTVEVTGEAYFEVAHNPQRHFLVKVRNEEGREPIEVLALGTSFNVNAYGDDNNMRATLLEGVVRVTSRGKDLTIKPGQQVMVSGADMDKMKLKTVDSERAVAWKNGIFDFEEDHLKDILRQISRWYGVQVEGQIPDKFLTGVIRRNVNLSEVLKMLGSATKDVDFSIRENSIIVKNNSNKN